MNLKNNEQDQKEQEERIRKDKIIERRLWILENPPEYKYGDIAWWQVEDDYEEVKILDSKVANPSYWIYSYYLMYLIDTGTYVKWVNYYELSSEKQKAKSK